MRTGISDVQGLREILAASFVSALFECIDK